MLCFINRYFNIILGNNKKIPLNKFNIYEVRHVLEIIEGRLFNLLQAEAELLLKGIQNFSEKCKYTNLSPNTSFNPYPIIKDTSKFNQVGSENRITDLESKLNDLLAQNKSLKSTIEDLNRKLVTQKKKFNTINRFESRELNGETVYSFEILAYNSCTEDETVNRKTSELSTMTTKSRKNSGKFKVIESGNLYDKYSNKKTESYISGHWAMDGFESIVKKERNSTKVRRAITTNKLGLDKNLIMPIKPLLNKQTSTAKIGSSKTPNCKISRV